MKQLRNHKYQRVFVGFLAVLLCMSTLCLVAFSAQKGNEKSDGIHVKNVPAGVVTVTVETKDGKTLVIDSSAAHGIQWELDTQCEERNVQSIALHYADGTDVPLTIVYRTEWHGTAETNSAIIGNTGAGTLDIWIQNAPGEVTTAPEESTAVSEITTPVPEEITTAPEEITTAPEETTAVPETTTAAPKETTAEPVATTAATETTGILAPPKEPAVTEPELTEPAPGTDMPEVPPTTEDPGTTGGTPDSRIPEDPEEETAPVETPSGAMDTEIFDPAPDTGDSTLLWLGGALLALAAVGGVIYAAKKSD